MTSIDQVFNGIGYVGSTVFALPGVKGLIPNGRNADGTLNNTEFSYTQVNTFTYTINGTYYIRCSTNFLNLFISTTEYRPDTNYNVYNNTNQTFAMAGTLTISGGVITSFEPNTAFHAVDYSEFTSAIELLKTIDYVVASQEPTAGNNYTWYRLYKSGWVEQGGYLPATGSGNTLQTVNLPKAMNDAHYTVTTSITDATFSFAPDWYQVTVQQQTSTGFKTYTGSDWGKYWSVSGKALS